MFLISHKSCKICLKFFKSPVIIMQCEKNISKVIKGDDLV